MGLGLIGMLKDWAQVFWEILSKSAKLSESCVTFSRQVVWERKLMSESSTFSADDVMIMLWLDLRSIIDTKYCHKS